MIAMDKELREVSLEKEFQQSLVEPPTQRDRLAYTMGFYDAMALMKEKEKEDDTDK